MLHLYACLAAGQSVTDDPSPSPTPQHDDTPRQVVAADADAADATVRHEKEMACLATITDARQQCGAARDLLADATERGVCSQHTLASPPAVRRASAASTPCSCWPNSSSAISPAT